MDINMKKIILFILLSILFTECNRNSDLAKLPPEAKDSSGAPHKKGLHSKNEPPPPIVQPTPLAQVATANVSAVNANEVSVNTLTATVNGVETSPLSFRISGYISEVLVKNGQVVKKGQVIARLDNSIALQNLNLSKLALQQADTVQHFAELTLKRTQTLNQRQATTQIALEQAELGFQNAQIAFKTAESNLKLAQINYDETNLIAPFDGYMFNLVPWIGTYVSSTSIIGNLTSVNDLQITIPVPQTITNNFSIGQEFSFSNASQNIGGTLKITGIVPYVDQNTKTYLLYGVPVKVRGQLMANELVIIDLK